MIMNCNIEQLAHSTEVKLAKGFLCLSLSLSLWCFAHSRVVFKIVNCQLGSAHVNSQLICVSNGYV